MNEVIAPERKEVSNRDYFSGFGELMEASKVIAKSSIIPLALRNKPDDVFVTLQYGKELGMKPMTSLQNIFVVNGKPTLSAQIMAGLVKSRSDFFGCEIESSTTKARVSVTRKYPSGLIETQTGEFTIEQAKAAGLLSKDNWRNYPQQMLEARASAFAYRKSYQDILAGIYTPDEVDSLTDEDFQNMKKAETKEPEKKAEPEKKTLPEQYKELMTEITSLVKSKKQNGNNVFTESEIKSYSTECKLLNEKPIKDTIEGFEKVIVELKDRIQKRVNTVDAEIVEVEK